MSGTNDLLANINLKTRMPMKTSHQNKRVQLGHKLGDLNKSNNQSQHEMMKEFRTLQKTTERRRLAYDLKNMDNQDIFDDGPPAIVPRDKLMIQRKNEQIYQKLQEK